MRTHLAPLPADAAILDVGCGNRPLGPELRLAARGVGIDLARAALRSASPPRSGLLADARRLPFRAGAFAAVALRHVLGHLAPEEAAEAAGEALRVLASGGVLLAEVFGKGDLRDGVGTPEDGGWKRGGIVTRYFEKDELAELFPDSRDVLVADARVPRRFGVRRVLRASLRAPG